MNLAIRDYHGFKADIMDVDFAEFQRNPGNLRIAFHCAISLFHLADWIYVAHKPIIDASFAFTAGGRTYPVRSEKDFANALADLHPDFELVRAVANSAKHLQLRPPPSTRAQPPGTPRNAANTQSVSYGALGSAPFGAGPLGGWTDVELEGTNRKMVDIASSVHRMWEQLLQKHSW